MRDFPEYKWAGNCRANELCMNCVNGAGGCEWSDHLRPVPGWKAEKVDDSSRAEKIKDIQGYRIFDCPKYEKGDRLWSKRKIQGRTNASR